MSNCETEWFKTWFNRDYAELYSNRDLPEAESQVAFLLDLSELKDYTSDLSVLDVACGTGRHLGSLLAKSKTAYGLDLSKALLDLSSKELVGHLVIADMRQLPIASQSFNLVTSFFTSFGYFSSSADELRVLKEFYRILARDGLVFFDLANKEFVLATLVAEESVNYSSGTAAIERKIIFSNGQTRVQKSITLKKLDGTVVTNQEDVHLFDDKELSELLKLAGFKPVRIFGSFNKEDYTSSSKRLILLAQKV